MLFFFQSFYDWYSKGAFLERDLMTSLFAKIICGPSVLNYNACEQLIMYSIYGKDVQQFNTVGLTHWQSYAAQIKTSTFCINNGICTAEATVIIGLILIS